MELYKFLTEVPEKDYCKIIDFLKNCWSENHALVKSKELMDFQHYNKQKGVYNFIVAENQETGKYDALTGYIPTGHYDEGLMDNGDYWGAIWKRRDVIDNDEGGQLGLEVWERLFQLSNFKSLGGISLSGDAIRWYNALHWKLFYMHHYYILNRNYKSFKIANNVTEDKYKDTSVDKPEGWSLKKISLNEIREGDITPLYKPYKSIAFLKNRYQKHPIYNYAFWGLYQYDKIYAILVSRTVSVNDCKVLRIVDALGELKGYIYHSLQSILQEGNYEYVDFLNYGIENDVFKEMGFQELDFEKDKIVIPNYFEPFEQRNVKMMVMHRDKYDRYVAFKGDADQDRPSII